MDWLTREITTGFQKLLCLSLDRTPAADLIQGTVASWLEALTVNRNWVEEQDAKRVRQAFITLAQTRRTWPVPADFFDALPRPEAQRALTKQHIPADPVRAAAAISEVRELLNPRAGKVAAAGPDA